MNTRASRVRVSRIEVGGRLTRSTQPARAKKSGTQNRTAESITSAVHYTAPERGPVSRFTYAVTWMQMTPSAATMRISSMSRRSRLDSPGAGCRVVTASDPLRSLSVATAAPRTGRIEVRRGLRGANLPDEGK